MGGGGEGFEGIRAFSSSPALFCFVVGDRGLAVWPWLVELCVMVGLFGAQ